MRTTLRRVGLLAATSALSWTAFAATGAAAYAGQSDKGNGESRGNSAAAHQNGRGADDTKSGSSDHSSGTSGTSGDPTQPQPPSNADQNPGGANGQCPGGPYCSTRDGSASGNGNGNGNATGKPCAGCVGKADNKNPKGQQPNGSDRNAGYECDRNSGIGRSNPAHTGCAPSSSPPPPPPTCSGDTCGTEGGGTVPPTCSGPSCDGGQSGGSTPPVTCTDARLVDGACVSGVTLSRDGSTPPAIVLAESASRTPVVGATSAARLPFTGSAVDRLLFVGILALLVGSVCLALARRCCAGASATMSAFGRN